MIGVKCAGSDNEKRIGLQTINAELYIIFSAVHVYFFFYILTVAFIVIKQSLHENVAPYCPSMPKPAAKYCNQLYIIVSLLIKHYCAVVDY